MANARVAALVSLGALGKDKSSIEYAPPRAGDVRDSKADLTRITKQLGFTPSVSLEQGIPEYVAWAKRDFANPPVS